MARLKLNVQTRVGNNLLGVGVYDTDGIDANALKEIEEYCATQKSLPLEKRDIPPYFEILDANGGADNSVPPTDIDDDPVSKYIGLKNKELRDIAMQRGLDVKGLKSNEDFIKALVEADTKSDDENDETTSRFLSTEDFSKLSAKEQVEYLDEIFGLPDDIDEESEEAEQYSDELIEIVNAYAGLSLKADVISKVKEIISYYEDEE